MRVFVSREISKFENIYRVEKAEGGGEAV